MFKEIKKIKTGFLSRNTALMKIGGLTLLNQIEKSLLGKTDNLEKIQKIAAEFSELKGSIMKAGQLFSVYGESFLPEKTLSILRTLQAESFYVSYETIIAEIRKSSPEILDDFKVGTKPIGSASIGQVHLATHIKTGKEYVIKVQFPDIQKSIDMDIMMLKFFFNSLRILPKRIKLGPILEEIKRMLIQELDYLMEANFALAFREHLKDDERFLVPKVYKKYSTKNILVTQYSPGVSLHEAVTSFSQVERNELAASFFELIMKEVFEWKMIQSDPNFGNFAIGRGRDGKPHWILYDFGATHVLDSQIVKNLNGLVASVLSHDRKSFIKHCADINIMTEDDNEDYIENCWDYCLHFLTPVRGREFDFKDSLLPNELAEKARVMMFSFPANRTPPFKTIFIDRKIAGTFFILKKMEAKLDIARIVHKYIKVKSS